MPGTVDRGHLILAWYCWIAIGNGRAVGYVDYGIRDDRTGWLGIVVAPELRGQGWSRAILEAVIAHPTTAGVTLCAGIDPANLASLRCFAAAGFEPLCAGLDDEGMVRLAHHPGTAPGQVA